MNATRGGTPGGIQRRLGILSYVIQVARDFTPAERRRHVEERWSARLQA